MIKFPTPAPPVGGHVLGQPFTVQGFSLAVNAVIVCNCAPDNPPLQVVASALVTCPSCQKRYALAVNPATGQLSAAISDPAAAQVES